jgi:uncharacterized protein YdcH (DUF465 family)
MVQIHARQLQLIQLFLMRISIFIDNMREEVLHLSDVINKNLQEMFNVNLLLLFQVKVLEVLRGESLALVRLELYKGVDNLSDQRLQLVDETTAVVVTHSDPALPILVTLSPDGLE